MSSTIEVICHAYKRSSIFYIVVMTCCTAPAKIKDLSYREVASCVVGRAIKASVMIRIKERSRN